MYSLNMQRVVSAPAKIVWEVISDIERYADYAPNLSKAIKTSNGVTPTRRCYDTKGNGWNEACILWKEGEVYSFVVDTTPDDYPYPFSHVKGTWGLNQVENGVEIYMEFEYQPDKAGILGWLMHRMIKRSFQPIVDTLMDNWKAEINQRVQDMTNAPLLEIHVS